MRGMGAVRWLRLAARSLGRAPALTVTVVASLGIGIAATTAVFSVADAVLFRALPFRDAGQLVWIASVRPQRSDAPFSLPEFMDYAERTRTVEIAAFTSWSAALSPAVESSRGGVASRLQGMRISANAFDVLGAYATAGRLLRPADDGPDARRVVLLSHAFWLARFGGSGSIIGRTVRLNEQPHEVVGVLPRHFPLPLRDVDVVVPLSPALDPRRHVRTSTNFLRLFGRVRAPASMALVDEELDNIAAALRRGFPAEYESKLGVAVTPMQEFLVGSTRQTFVVMLGAAGLLLGIALANVLNLLLVRGVGRRGEMALRRALGGSWRHLVYGAASEAVLLSLAGAAAGALLANWLVAFVSSSSIGVLRIDEARVSGRTLLLTTAIAVVATLLCSAIQLASAARSTPRGALTALGRGLHISRAQSRLRAVLLVVQLGFAVLLTIVTATMGRSLTRLQAVALGYRPDSVFVARLSLPPQGFHDVARLAAFAEQLEERLHGERSVAAAGAISIAPLSGNLAIIPFSIAGRPPADGRERLEANFRVITPGYLSTVGATVRAGRTFARADDRGAARVAIINRALAERYFAGTDPIGGQLLIDDNNAGPRPVTIVGIVDDMRHVSIDGPVPFDIYIPMGQLHPDGLVLITGSQFWMVRIASGVADRARAVFARGIAAIDGDVAVSGVRPLRAYVDDQLASRRFSVLALLGFVVVALVLATIGVYGVVAYSVEQRRREVGLRLALGATATAVVRSFVWPALTLALTGVAIGVTGALLTRHVVAGLLFGVTPTDPVVLGLVALSLLETAAVAAVIAATRAALIEPASALTGE